MTQITTELGAHDRVIMMYTWEWMPEVGHLVVREEVLCGSHRLYPIHMTLLLNHLAKNEDACTMANKSRDDLRFFCN